MEKMDAKTTWDTFWTTGKVTDYLSYRNSVGDSESSGTAGDCNGHGVEYDAHIGLRQKNNDTNQRTW